MMDAKEPRGVGGEWRPEMGSQKSGCEDLDELFCHLLLPDAVPVST